MYTDVVSHVITDLFNIVLFSEIIADYILGCRFFIECNSLENRMYSFVHFGWFADEFRDDKRRGAGDKVL